MDPISADRNQEVHRDRRNFEFTKLEANLDDVDRLFAHAYDHARTGFNAISFGGFERGDAIGIGMRRCNLVVAPLARVKVVVHPIQAGFFQDLCVDVALESGRDADFDRPA